MTTKKYISAVSKVRNLEMQYRKMDDERRRRWRNIR